MNTHHERADVTIAGLQHQNKSIEFVRLSCNSREFAFALNQECGISKYIYWNIHIYEVPNFNFKSIRHITMH